jgi:hypothetical protein
MWPMSTTCNHPDEDVGLVPLSIKLDGRTLRWLRSDATAHHRSVAASVRHYLDRIQEEEVAAA